MLLNTLSAYETNWVAAGWNSSNTQWANLRDMINILASNRYNSGVTAGRSAAVPAYYTHGVNSAYLISSVTISLSLASGTYLVVIAASSSVDTDYPGSCTISHGTALASNVAVGYSNGSSSPYGGIMYMSANRVTLTATTTVTGTCAASSGNGGGKKGVIMMAFNIG